MKKYYAIEWGTWSAWPWPGEHGNKEGTVLSFPSAETRDAWVAVNAKHREAIAIVRVQP